MADTLNFGPEWLRALSDGNSAKAPPPTLGCAKYKLADHRYGREEMLALYSDDCKIPEALTALPSIVVERAQQPMSLTALSEEEQRLISTSVNSQAVLRLFGRGGPPTRGGRGAVVERGRGRGRGRGEGFPPRTPYEEGEAGVFGRPRGPPKNDAWEEVGVKRFDRSFSGQYEEGSHRKDYNRSQSSDNWRDREQEQEIDNDGDWRRAGSKWNSRTSWRDSGTAREKGGYDVNWQNKQQKGPFTREKNRENYRSRTSESWDDEEIVPEWSMPDSEEIEELGTFDSSGAFVSNKSKAREKGRENVNSDIDTSKEDFVSKKADVKVAEEKEVDTEPEISLQEKPAETVPAQEPEVPPVVKNSVDKKKPTVKISESDTNVRTVNANTQNNIDDRQKPVTVVPEIKQAPGMPSRTGEKNYELETAALNDMEEAVESMVAQMTAEDEEKAVGSAVPMDHENAMKWFYRDPQGDLQGPFNASEMAEWFSAGYFTMNLMVKRGCDEKFSPLGELIKHWARVPFVPGPTMPPLLTNPPPPPSIVSQQQEQLKMLQQQFLIQQQVMTQQFLRHMQMQHVQQIMTQLQEDEEFKALPMLQQHNLAMQCLMSQQLPNAAKRSSPTELAAAGSSTSHPAFHRSHSQPANISQGKSEDVPAWSTGTSVSSGNLSLPASVWDLDNQQSIPQIPEDIEAQLRRAKLCIPKEDDQKKREEEEFKQQLLQQRQEELRQKQEEIQRQRELVERERLRLEKIEMQRIEEVKKKEEEQRRIAEEAERKRQHMEELRKQQEEQRRRFEEEQKKQQEQEMRRKQEEELRRQQEEEMRRQQEEKLRKEEQRKKQEEDRRQEELRKQQEEEDYRRQEELKRQETEKRQEMEKQKQLELQRNQELQRQQQEALRKLQQEQLAKLQLPAHAQWGSQSHQAPQSQQPAMSLLHIQQQEEHTRQQEEQFQRQVEIQRQQMMALQEQQQQQQQKTWAAQRLTASQQSAKSLLEIQEEQARQLQQEQSLQQEKKQSQAKNLNMGSSVWSSSGSGWASEGSWTNSMLTTENNQVRNNSSQSLGFWDDAVQTAPKKSSKKANNNAPTSEFPSLGSSIRTTSGSSVSKQTKAPRTNKDEEAVQRLFQSKKPEDNFTQWCTNTLRNLATSVDVPTFVAFLQEIESPYEVHDYVRSYLGESKAARDFGKQFLEKRSEFYGRKKSQTQESSMPSLAEAFAQPAYKQPQQSYEPETQKSKGKKKKKMTKIDSSVLGFTVHAAPDRINIGEIDTLDGH